MVNVEVRRWLELDYRSSEAYKSLRTNIEFCGADVKVIAVTSCTPGEGKSSVSMQIAASFAESGRKVLFLDADMRKSALLGRYRIRQEIKGFSHYLSGNSSFAEVLCKTDVENLDMVFSGVVPPNPVELLDGARFRDLLKKARDEYDYIIIDTPPLGSVIDSAVAAKACDGVAIVVASDAVSYKFIRRIQEQLERTGCRILGVVLNKVERFENKYYGKYYGNYQAKETR